MKNRVYLNFVLTVIAALNGSEFLGSARWTGVHAQSTQLAAASLLAPVRRGDRDAGFQKQLNAVVNGGEIVEIASQDQGNSIVVVFKQLK